MTDDSNTSPRPAPIPLLSKCPICKRRATHEFRPFCSKRCADVDLSRWFSGVYAVPVAETDEPDGDEFSDV